MCECGSGSDSKCAQVTRIYSSNGTRVVAVAALSLPNVRCGGSVSLLFGTVPYESSTYYV